jgi:hypothetical protein
VRDEPQILLDELFVEGGRVQQAGAWDREEGLFGGGGKARNAEVAGYTLFQSRVVLS